jgi:hypothetical protein
VHGAFYVPEPCINPHMAMAITMRMVIQILFFAIEVTQGPL